MSTSALLALLDEPGLIEDEHSVFLAEVLEDVCAHVVAYLVRIPVDPAEQVPEPAMRANRPSNRGNQLRGLVTGGVVG